MLGDMDPGSLLVIAGCVVLFVIQLLLCLLSRRVFVSLIPTILAVLFAGGCFAMLFFAKGLEVLGHLLLAVIACFPVEACVLAWIVFLVVWIIKRITGND